jgi:hypothetical protein
MRRMGFLDDLGVPYAVGEGILRSGLSGFTIPKAADGSVWRPTPRLRLSRPLLGDVRTFAGIVPDEARFPLLPEGGS